MSSRIKSTILKLITDKPVRKTPYQVKGVFIRHFKDELIVPMLNGSSRDKFLYPRVQVKILNEQIYIIGIKEGSDPVRSISEKIKKLDFGNITFEVESSEIIETDNDFISSKQLITYKFLTPWVALNHINRGKYKKLDDEKKHSFLNKLIGQNIVFLANELDLSLEKNIYIKIETNDFSPKKVDEKNWGSFEGGVKTNCILPNYIGLGNGITRGFGTIYFETKLIKEDISLESKPDLIEESIDFKNDESLDLIAITDVPKPRRRNLNKKFKSSKKFKENPIKKTRSKKSNKNYSKSTDPKVTDNGPSDNFNRIEKVNEEEKNFNTESYHKRQHKF